MARRMAASIGGEEKGPAPDVLDLLAAGPRLELADGPRVASSHMPYSRKPSRAR